ncbi:hypothetical protein E1B28_003183 [Marasmius oreades]|uniref:Uncharacterized protein n=1 Tax=Marasmius oreades TaxID=181124 RepID=A0A9P7UM27_9AGAR|nr:uncharacterized protein E1B28_003183 [Marasmius oreades]KAG7085636.1 hypothetical protein E1B28_003183 [Marasmius oreades]
MSGSQAGFGFLALQQAFRDYRSQLEDIYCAIIQFHDEAWILPAVAMLSQLSYLLHDYGLEFEHWRYSPEAINEFFQEHGVFEFPPDLLLSYLPDALYMRCPQLKTGPKSEPVVLSSDNESEPLVSPYKTCSCDAPPVDVPAIGLTVASPRACPTRPATKKAVEKEVPRNQLDVGNL